ncbi:MAG TPA: hypothetical protein VK498_11525 [Ferruginibacter sp.]|nr:hypothetical protein [Ferruginibacter sp.]
MEKLNVVITLFMIKLEKNIFNLDTYGSADRQIIGKVSQSIQFSPEAIKQLKELILKKF